MSEKGGRIPWPFFADQPPTSANSASFPPGVSSPQDPQQPPLHPPTLDEIDVTRHREITTNAVSAILLLTLKWFKVSRGFVYSIEGTHRLKSLS